MNILEEGLPANLDAERFVLGTVFLRGEAMHDIRPVVEADDFSIEKHRRIWRAMCRLYDFGGAVDRVTVANDLLLYAELESVGGLTYLVTLDDGLPHVSNLSDYIQIVKDKALLRRIILAADNIQLRCVSGENPGRILDSLGQSIIDLSPKDEERRGFVSAAELIERTGINQLLSPRRDNGIPLPWSSLQDGLCGLHPEQLILLAAHTSCGKTSAALQVIHGAAHFAGVAVFSLEMSAASLFLRMVYQISRVDAERHRHGVLKPDEIAAMRAAANELHALPIYWNDTASCTVPAIHAELRKLRLRANVGLVVVDFLQIVRGTGRMESRNNEVGSNARGLKLAAKEFGVPFLVLSQLSRKSDAENREPKLSDLRDSGEIEENSDVVWFIHRAQSDPYNPVKPSRFIVAKQREGPRDMSFQMMFLSGSQRFEMAEKGDCEDA